MSLVHKSCKPCQGGIPPLKEAEYTPLLEQLDQGWQVLDQHHLHKSYSFPNFVTALDFTNKVGDIAEEEGHHPDIHLSWGNVVITIWTHKINGLSESDFILAAKIEALYASP